MHVSKLVKSKEGASKDTVEGQFSKFLMDPVVAGSMIVFALIALLLAILNFAQAINY